MRVIHTRACAGEARTCAGRLRAMLFAAFDHNDPTAKITLTPVSSEAWTAHFELKRAGSRWPTVMQIAEPGASELLGLAPDHHHAWLTAGAVHLT